MLMTNPAAQPSQPFPLVEAADPKDNRDDFLRSLDGVEGYSFPKTSRAGMIAQILDRRLWARAGDLRYPAWDIRMNFRWDMSGHVEGGEELCSTQDARWRKALDENDSIFRRACEKALDPYLDSDFRILGGDDDMLCALETIGPNGGFVIMRSLGGRETGFRNLSDARETLNAMPDADLRNVWAACRCLDVDLGRKNRIHELSWALNGIRAEMEAEWLEEIEPELEF